MQHDGSTPHTVTTGRLSGCGALLSTIGHTNELKVLDLKLKQNKHLTTFTRVVILTAFYFLGGLLGKEASFMSNSVALVWPPAGIALAAILLFGYRFWPGVALGAVLFSFLNGMPFGFFTLGTALGNTIGAIVCAYLLRKFVSFDNSMERTRDVVGYIVLACILGTSVNALFNFAGLTYSGAAEWEEAFPAILEWWVPNALAAMVVAPFLIAWASPTSTRWAPRLVIEALLCGAGLICGTLISFQSWFVYGIQNYPFAYLPFPFLVWGALRFGQRGATTGTLLVSVLAIYSLLQGRGPFVTATERDSLMLVGSYIGILAVTNMLLAAAATERRLAERAVSDSERRLRAVVEDQTDMICRFTPDGMITFVNGAYCRFRGQTKEHLIGTDFLKTLSEQDRAVALSYFNALAPAEPTISFDHRVSGESDVVLWHQYTVRRLFMESGAAHEFQAVIQDITQRKQSEQALAASEKKYRSLVANIPDVVWTVNANHELIYISDNVELMLGCKPRELISAGGAWWLKGTLPDDLQHLEAAFQRLFDEGQRLDVEYRFERPDGKQIWLQLRATSTQVRDGMICTDGLLSEVSERKRSEEALQLAKDAAEGANLSKSRFLANMSHELRTPLNAIIGFSEMLADQTFGPMNERQLKYANNVLSSGRHLLDLINDILDISKVEANRLELSPSRFHVNGAMRNVQTVVKSLANKKHHVLEVRVAPDLPPLVADEAKFKQIMYNLLSNAIKFTPDGGRITVEAGIETGCLEESEQCIVVRVSDSGIGIHPDDQERIFREFEQVDSSYGRLQQGTGLGLALTKKLIELHAGKIWVESEGMEGKGSTFAFALPARDLESVSMLQQVSAPESPAELQRPLVLVVSDSGERLGAVAHHLRSLGFEVVSVTSQSALEAGLNEQFPYALVVDEHFNGRENEPQRGRLRALLPLSKPMVLFRIEPVGGIEFMLYSSDAFAGCTWKSRLSDAVKGDHHSSSKEVNTVLIIDDEPAILSLLARTLLSKGAQVLTALDGHSGLQLAAEGRPDVIILDLGLPDISGTQVVVQLRNNASSQHVPIVVYTGIPLDENTRGQITHSVHSITSKPDQAGLFAELDRLSRLAKEEARA
jgi:PAS domain S-box-containing protein